MQSERNKIKWKVKAKKKTTFIRIQKKNKFKKSQSFFLEKVFGLIEISTNFFKERK